MPISAERKLVQPVGIIECSEIDAGAERVRQERSRSEVDLTAPAPSAAGRISFINWLTLGVDARPRSLRPTPARRQASISQASWSTPPTVTADRLGAVAVIAPPCRGRTTARRSSRG